MKEKKHNPQPLVLNEGYFIDHHYDGYDEFVGTSENWEYNCTYQLLPHALKGHHQVLQLHSMQLALVERIGGMMYDVISAKDCFTFAVIEESADKMCFGRMKIKAGDIFFFDDSEAFSFMSNGSMKFCVVNMQIEHLGDLRSQISKALNHTIKDTNNLLSKTLRGLWGQLTQKKNDTQSQDIFKEAEAEIKQLLMQLLSKQTPMIPKLTKGEETALLIRNQVYGHMDGKISIEYLAQQHQVSEKTLQNSFKSLFGFTPNRFLRLLKLNHIHHELKHLDPKESTVSRIAVKWGFTHMGQFTRYYTELFNENPSQTLKTVCCKEKSIDTSCAVRQEEMN